jgi:hypothetical protein
MHIKEPSHLGAKLPDMKLIADKIDQHFGAFGWLMEIHDMLHYTLRAIRWLRTG